MIDVRVSEYQFVNELVAHVGDVEIAFLTANPCIEADVKQHVAQLLADVGSVVLHQGVGELESLLDGVWPQAFVSLLLVPWTFLP